MADIISVEVKGKWKKTTDWLKKSENLNTIKQLYRYGEMGVEALSRATPVDTGKTAASWSYEIHSSKGVYKITWTNSNLAKGVLPVAILLQYGHATKNGGFVQGIDYINPALKPVFEKLANDAWEEVTK